MNDGTGRGDRGDRRAPGVLEVIMARRGRWRATLAPIVLPCLIAVAPSSIHAAAPRLYTRVYLDGRGNVHAVTTRGKDTRLTRRGRCRDPKLAPDGRTVGAEVVSRIEKSPGFSNEEVEVAQELWVYRDGRFLRRIVADGFIRDWRFWNGGKEVAIYSGGLHFAGFYVLYDLSSGNELNRSADPVTEQSPDWVRGIAEDPHDP